MPLHSQLHNRCFVMATWVVVLAVAAGCGASAGGIPPLAKVTGTITMDGKPLAEAMVNFTPQSSRPSVGKTDAAGKYSLKFNDDVEGAAIGTHMVQIVKIPSGTPSRENYSQMQIPAKYNFQSELKAEVKEGENNINFDLTSN